MTDLRYPNESEAYRDARDALIEAELSLVQQVKAVALISEWLSARGFGS